MRTMVECWSVMRRGTTLRVEASPAAVDHVEEVAADVHRSVDDSIRIVRVTGTLLDEPRSGLTALLRRVGEVAQANGKRFQVGPI